MNKLITAETARNIMKEFLINDELSKISNIIEVAANTGEYCANYKHKDISRPVIEKLLEAGYILHEKSDGIYPDHIYWQISWEYEKWKD